METQCGVKKIATHLWVSCKFFKTRQPRSCLIQKPRSSSTEALDRLDLKTLSKRRHFHCCVMMHKYLSGKIDFNFDIRRNSSFHSYQTRGSNDLHLPRVRTNWGKQTFIYQASKDWNSLDNNIKSSESMSFFKAKLKSL